MAEIITSLELLRTAAATENKGRIATLKLTFNAPKGGDCQMVCPCGEFFQAVRCSLTVFAMSFKVI